MQTTLGSRALAAAAVLALPAGAHGQLVMKFPVSGHSPYQAGLISSVLDHEVPLRLDQIGGQQGPYGTSGGVLSFTGELFLATQSYPARKFGCYPKARNTKQKQDWSPLLLSVYGGTAGCTKNAINYDNHPGYDYIIREGKEVNPAAPGYLIPHLCIRTFRSDQAASCQNMGAVAIDHGNGFITQYLHMKKKSLNYGKAVSKGINHWVDTKWVVGTVFNEGTDSVHLHLEVLQRKAKAVNTKTYYDAANYVVVDPYGYKSGSYYASLLMAKPGCLWSGGCRY
jgi:hypothetical protein